MRTRELARCEGCLGRSRLHRHLVPKSHSSDSENECESECELRRLDHQQLEHLYRQINFDQFIKLPDMDKKEDQKHAKLRRLDAL
ncbi:hypothetical protein MTO96_025395 [Rhipicephalus appendiculatus]